MQAQKPAEGISITNKFKKSTFFRVDCTCGDPDHEINFEVELDREFEDIAVSTWTVQKTPWWNEVVKPRYDIDNEFLQGLNWLCTGLINGLATRLRLTRDIWWKGYVKYEGTTSMNAQQALNYAEALKSAVEELEKIQKDNS